MSNRTIGHKNVSYSVDDILSAGGVDAFLKKKKINTARRKISGIIKMDDSEAADLVKQLRQQG